jgi:hypothetical protein
MKLNPHTAVEKLVLYLWDDELQNLRGYGPKECGSHIAQALIVASMQIDRDGTIAYLREFGSAQLPSGAWCFAENIGEASAA